MGYIKPEIKERADRERRTNIHRWFSNINVELTAEQLNIICDQLDIRSKSAKDSGPAQAWRDAYEGWDEGPTVDAPDYVDEENIRYVDLAGDPHYEAWKRHHRRWIVENNQAALEREINNPIPIKHKTGTVGWWCLPTRIQWGHCCVSGGWDRGEVFYRADIVICSTCGVERP